MSKYTTQVRWICESYNDKSDATLSEIINNAIPHIFDFDFPIFDPEYRNALCYHILLHYYTREIGLETVGLWKLKLNAKLNDIMPYYNQLYNSLKLEYDPTLDYNVTKKSTRKGNENSQYNTKNSGADYSLYSDTPQGALVGIDNGTYLSSATKNIAGTSTASGGESTTIDEYLETISGKIGASSYSKLIMEYRESLINVDMLIIEELQSLFMYLWE